MKSILIVLNILLAGAVLWGGVGFVKNLSFNRPKTAFTVKKRNPGEKKAAAAAVTSISKSVSSVPVSGDSLVKQIVEADIFNIKRCSAGFFQSFDDGFFTYRPVFCFFKSGYVFMSEIY